MARANYLIPGFQYRILDKGAPMGLEGEIVTIVDNHPQPDRLANGEANPLARKIIVRFSDGTVDYILPRQLNDEPMGIDSPAIQGAPVQTVVEETVGIPVAEVVSTSGDMATIINPVTGVAMTVQRTKVTPITDPMDPRLDHLRPSRSKVKRYLRRTMMNGMSDVDMLLLFTSDSYRVQNELRPASFMLKGDTQAGKTFLVEALAVAWADALGLPKPMPIFTLSGSSGVTDFDLFGQPTTYTDPVTGVDRLVWLPGTVAMAAECGGILYLDEINAMGERVTSSLHPLCDHRHQFTNRAKAVERGGVLMPEHVTAHQDLWIIATFNDGNYRGMGELNEAFINRFRSIRWGYDDEVEAKLITSPAIRLLGEALRNARKANVKGFRTPCGTAALMRLEQDVQVMGVDMGLEIFKGMFKHTEYDTVSEIIDVRIRLLLQEEANQAELNAIDSPGSVDHKAELEDMLGK